MFNKAFLTFSIVVVSFFLNSSGVQAQAVSEIEIIFDASRSMNDAQAGTSKLMAAKQALSTVASQIQAGSNVGLRVFGKTPVRGNVKDSCVDSKLVIPIQPFQSIAMISQVNALQAHGQTAIGYSLKLAANDFTAGAKKSIILISDGEESCGMNPIDVIADLKAQGIDIVIHTVGFDVNPKARAQLQQISEFTGGTYADARNAGELKASLTQVVQNADLLLKPQRGEGENILSASSGTRIVFSSTEEFAKLIDGKEDQTGPLYNAQEVVFSFKDNNPILLEKFAIPVFKQGSYNVGTVELFGSYSDPDSGYFPVALIQVKNRVFYENVYQEFTIDPPKALKYLKAVMGYGSSGSQAYSSEWKAYGEFLEEDEFKKYMKAEEKKEKNILAANNGGQLIAASNVNFKYLIDGTDRSHGQSVSIQPIQEGIFGFKDGKTALINKMAIPILESSDKNVKTVEILVSTSSPTSGYESVGTFETMNLVFAGNPYQEFVFEKPVKAKYLKIVVKATHGLYYCNFHELQAFGTVE